MNKIIILCLSIFSLNSCVQDYTSIAYLKQVDNELKKIESATYWSRSESWNHGDTVPAYITKRYVESYRNIADSTLGASWAIFEDEDKAHLEFAYDGKIRTLIYDDSKTLVLDSFKVNKRTFRPVSLPFFSYAENIINYVLENNDSTSIVQEDLGSNIYLKLTIYEDRQVEFFGKAHYMPKNPYTFDPSSIYEIWINKKTNLPWKIRREMCHNISVESISDYEFDRINLDDFVASDYFQKDYEIKQYGQQKKKKQANALIGKRAPEWTLQTHDKEEISMSELKSKVIMIQFTSVSCGPCKASIPFLKELSSEYGKDDFDFVAIECSSKSTNALCSYMRRNDFNYKFLLSTNNVREKYSIKSFPIFFILDEDRIIKNVINGYGMEITDKKIRNVIDKMIKADA